MTANDVGESTREALILEGKLMLTVASYVLFKMLSYWGKSKLVNIK